MEWTDRGRAVRSEIDLSHCHFVYHKSYVAVCIRPGLRGLRPDTDCPSHGTTDTRGDERMSAGVVTFCSV